MNSESETVRTSILDSPTHWIHWQIGTFKINVDGSGGSQTLTKTIVRDHLRKNEGAPSIQPKRGRINSILFEPQVGVGSSKSSILDWRR